MRGPKLHSCVLRYRDGRPPCGYLGNAMTTRHVENVTCRNCQGQLLIAMAQGVLKADFPYWWKYWVRSAETVGAARVRYSTSRLNKGVDMESIK